MIELTYTREPMTPCFDEMKALTAAHHVEVDDNRESMPLDVDWDRFAQLEAAGMVLFVSVRAVGELVGYFIGFVMPHLHYKRTTVCICDAYYIHGDYRGGGAGQLLLEHAIAAARETGAVNMVLSMKSKHDHSTMLERLGFVEFERNFTLMVSDHG